MQFPPPSAAGVIGSTRFTKAILLYASYDLVKFSLRALSTSRTQQWVLCSLFPVVDPGRVSLQMRSRRLNLPDFFVGKISRGLEVGMLL